ncbi:hypothetical protein LUZ62_022924 [Rhynchospora pubera]|uniref:Uncharacterized protein n=1 Tax=Rhynchospora pubera TaxID=906938 RepID=A0AAV8CT45_9POAL|nr:hypothetical protein LUZ62_068274 [Rhynchospora pubera]KAJ4810358.1 hypothetical protein LUZ62_022924 [Rhynchospora pubera]
MVNLAMILVVLVFLCLSSSISARPIYNKPTAYEMLEKFNFPKGILPTGVESYNLSPSGEFEVFLKSDCEFRVDGGYLLKYKNRISGKVEFGSIQSLDGVSVKVFFMWFGVNEVIRNNADLNFFVGPLSASFSASSFEESPRCSSEFDCNSQSAGCNGDVIEVI